MHLKVYFKKKKKGKSECTVDRRFGKLGQYTYKVIIWAVGPPFNQITIAQNLHQAVVNIHVEIRRRRRIC